MSKPRHPRRNPGSRAWYEIEMSIFCPHCDFEADDVKVLVSADGSTEKYKCPDCKESVVGANDDDIAEELRREIRKKYGSGIGVDQRKNPSRRRNGSSVMSDLYFARSFGAKVGDRVIEIREGKNSGGKTVRVIPVGFIQRVHGHNRAGQSIVDVSSPNSETDRVYTHAAEVDPTGSKREWQVVRWIPKGSVASEVVTVRNNPSGIGSGWLPSSWLKGLRGWKFTNGKIIRDPTGTSSRYGAFIVDGNGDTQEIAEGYTIEDASYKAKSWFGHFGKSLQSDSHVEIVDERSCNVMAFIPPSGSDKSGGRLVIGDCCAVDHKGNSLLRNGKNVDRRSNPASRFSPEDYYDDIKIPRGFKSSFWRHDENPKWVDLPNRLVLFVGHKDPDRRDDAERFTLAHCDSEGEVDWSKTYATDSWTSMMHAIRVGQGRSR